MRLQLNTNCRRQRQCVPLTFLKEVALLCICFCFYSFHHEQIAVVYSFTWQPPIGSSYHRSHDPTTTTSSTTRVGFKQPIMNYELAPTVGGTDEPIIETSLTTDDRRQISLDRLNTHHAPTNNTTVVEQTMGPSPDSSEHEHNYYLPDTYQHETIRSDAPAILLESGPGTGKTTVLASRIAYLLRTKQALPQNMVVLSFTKRDATALKEKALNMLFDDDRPDDDDARIECDKMLWSGTIHSFAKNILQICDAGEGNPHGTTPLRIVSTREMRSRVKQCLGQLPPETFDLFQKALDESNQRVGTLISDVMRCIDLWQEAGVLSTPYNHCPDFFDDGITTPKRELNKGIRMPHDTNIELAMRLGITCNVATIAMEISGDYQTLHASTGTTDPSNVAGLAYYHLLTNPEELSRVRSKLDHVILDEYQDVSVSQHKLLRLLIRGANDERNSVTQTDSFGSGKSSTNESHLQILTKRDTLPRAQRRDIPCFRVPKLMCAGDMNQSIYGWRGAAPSLTVDSFHKDFPQGVLVPLSTSYRLPFQILNAANVLMSDTKTVEPSNQQSFEISPAAARATAENARDSSQCLSHNAFGMNNFVLGKKLLIEDALMSESRSSVFIKGLWDMREEAKFVASAIRKRSKERVRSCAVALSKLNIGTDEESSQYEPSTLLDSTDVAIMVRTSGAMKLFEEALIKNGIPYITSSEAEGDAKSESAAGGQEQKQRHWKGHDTTLLPMKPVKIITMHSAKGQEFDDVYLAGWTESVFPHPSSVSNNRLYEERRIAYVALTRARQRVLVTYSFVRSVAHFGPNGERKDVTEQVKPSRFLFDLLSKTPIVDDSVGSRALKKPKIQQAAVEWDNSIGFKEIIAGKDLPPHFAKSYRAPPNFKPKSRLSVPTSTLSQTKEQANKPTKPERRSHTMIETGEKQSAPFSLLQKVTSGLTEVFSGRKGVMKTQRTAFRSILKEYGITRGAAVVLNQSVYSPGDKAMDVLTSAHDENLTTCALSKCTAKQLGLYLYYVLSRTKEQNEKSANPSLLHHKLVVEAEEQNSSLHLLERVTSGLTEVFSGRKGVMKTQRAAFRSILKECGIKRGVAIVLKKSVQSPGDKAMDALICAPDEDLTTCAISKCTAKQLGLYLYYLLTKRKQ